MDTTLVDTILACTIDCVIGRRRIPRVTHARQILATVILCPTRAKCAPVGRHVNVCRIATRARWPRWWRRRDYSVVAILLQHRQPKHDCAKRLALLLLSIVSIEDVAHLNRNLRTLRRLELLLLFPRTEHALQGTPRATSGATCGLQHRNARSS